MTLDITDVCPNNLQGSSASIFLLLINTLMKAKCPLGSVEQYPKNYGPELSDNQQFDFIIVGGGSAGSVLANRLTENAKWNVLVLEAGGYPPATSDIPLLAWNGIHTSEDWQYETEPSDKVFFGHEKKRCRWPRGKMLGGSSSNNILSYVRGNKRDYDQWSEMGNRGWDWKTVSEYFRKMENLKDGDGINYGHEGLLGLYNYSSGEPVLDKIKEASLELGYPTSTDENRLNLLGFFEVPMTIENGTRLNAAKAFLGKVKERKNLFVAVNSSVTKILIDNKTKSAIGVEVVVNGKLYRLLAKNEVILSAGVIGSPQLLMLSGVGPQAHLANVGIETIQNLPVGMNLQDHCNFMGFCVKLNTKSILNKPPEKVLDDIYEYFLYRTGPFSQVSLANVLGFINTRNDSIYPNVQYHHCILTPENDYSAAGAFERLGFGSYYAELVERLRRAGNQPALCFYPILINPKSRGKVLLRSDRPEDKPIIDSGYYTDGKNEDMEIILEGIRFAERMSETKAFSKFEPEIMQMIPECDSFKFRSDDYWKCALKYLTSTTFHPIGTCKMGPEEEEATVVDSRLRVKGIKRLRVVDASVMPKIVSGNTNAASMMIGYNGGEMIIKDWMDKHDEL